jgi:hypothetical protein
MTKERKHTPSPWELDSAFPDIDGYKILGGSLAFRKGKRIIAVVRNQGSRPIIEDSLADARLIAAAPEMYEALKAYEALENQRMNCDECGDQLERSPEACGECFPFADDARCKIRAVIAKIEVKE